MVIVLSNVFWLHFWHVPESFGFDKKLLNFLARIETVGSKFMEACIDKIDRTS